MTRTQANDAYAALLRPLGGTEAEWHALRELAKGDLFFLLVHILGRKDADRDWIFERCREVQASPNGYLDLWAREHYKSTIITLALTIQDILNDPEITVGIFSHTRPIAKGFLRQIKRELEGSDKLKGLFPDVLYADPQRQSPKWSEDDGIIVKRKSNPKEATVEAWGLVDGQPTSKHFRLLVYDDVVTRESVTTPEMIRKVTDAWALSLNLGADGGRRRIPGTRYHFADTYHEIIKRGAAIPRIHPATADGTPEGRPVLLSPEQLAIKRRDMGAYIFACQMLQNPKEDGVMGFNRNDLRFWPAKQFGGMNIYMLVDPASSKKKGSDYTAIFVIGAGMDGNYYVITMVRDRLNLTERAAAVFALHRQYSPIRVGYEKYGLQADTEHIDDVMTRENYRFEIAELGGSLAKEERIRRLVPLAEQHRIWLPDTCIRTNRAGQTEDLTKVFIDEEWVTFPLGLHDDMIDDLSRICDEDMGIVFPKAPGRFRAPMQTEAIA